MTNRRVGRLFDLGFTVLALYYATLDSQRPVFEPIASEMSPALRKSQKPPE